MPTHLMGITEAFVRIVRTPDTMVRNPAGHRSIAHRHEADPDDHRPVAADRARAAVSPLAGADRPADYGTPDTQRGVALFKELGFILPPEDRADFADMFGDDDQLFFERLIEDLDAQSCVLKLFLEDGIGFEARMERIKATSPLLTLPSDYFPRELTVTDACVTNSGFVWFTKHFYL
jgi:hypothetical protein